MEPSKRRRDPEFEARLEADALKYADVGHQIGREVIAAVAEDHLTWCATWEPELSDEAIADSEIEPPIVSPEASPTPGPSIRLLGRHVRPAWREPTGEDLQAGSQRAHSWWLRAAVVLIAALVGWTTATRAGRDLVGRMSTEVLAWIGIAPPERRPDVNNPPVRVPAESGDQPIVAAATPTSTPRPTPQPSAALSAAGSGQPTRAGRTDNATGRCAFVLSDDSVTVIDTSTEEVIGKPIPVGSGARDIALTPDGEEALVVGTDASDSGRLLQIDVRSGKVVSHDVDADTIFVAAGPDRIAYLFHRDGGRSRISKMDLRTGKLLCAPIQATGSFAGIGRPTSQGMALSRKGDRLFLALGHGGEDYQAIRVIDTARCEVAQELGNGNGFPVDVSIVPSGSGPRVDRVLVSNGIGGDITVLDVDTGSPVGELAVPGFGMYVGGVCGITSTPSVDEILVYSCGSLIYTFDSQDWTETSPTIFLESLSIFRHAIAVARTTQGDRAFAVQSTGFVRVIDLDAHELLENRIPVGNSPYSIVIGPVCPQ